jgi:hypothetical protein
MNLSLSLTVLYLSWNLISPWSLSEQMKPLCCYIVYVATFVLRSIASSCY